MKKFTFLSSLLKYGVLLLGAMAVVPATSYASDLMGVEASEIQSKRGVTGIVLDTDGNAVVGALVLLKGTTTGNITDAEGKFTLQLPAEGVSELEISYIGYVNKTVSVSATTGNIQVVLEIDNLQVDEVVVVGYGTQRKVNLTGSVMQVNSDELENRPVANASQMLQGAMPNVNITFNSGSPDATAKIEVRGQASINGGEPLVLVDGVPGSIDRINPSDIESVSVLKDASSSAIYGARGAFGVVLITTKKGKEGKMSVSYSGNVAFSTPTTATNYMTNGYEYLSIMDEAFLRSQGNTYTRYSEEDYAEVEARRYDTVENPDRPWTVVKNHNGKDIYNYYGNYNWYDTFFNDIQPSNQHNVSLSGGNEKVNFMISGNYYSKEGIMKMDTDKYTKYNFRSKVEAQVFPFLKVSNNTQYFDSKYRYPGKEGGGNANFTNINMHGLPVYAPINPDGTASYSTRKNNYSITDGQSAMLINGKQGGEETIHEFRTTTSAKLDLGKHVDLNADYTFSAYITNDWYRSAVAQYSVEPGVMEDVPNYNTDQFKSSMKYNPLQVINTYISFDNSYGKHNISAMGGINYEYQKTNSLSATRKNLISESLNDLNLGTGDMTVGGGKTEYALFGAFARLNYDYDGKYLVEFSGRYDGTSKYEDGLRFGFFPSFSAGWRISEEEFFTGVKDAVNNLKLRASYGTLGNQLSGSNMYPYVSTMGMSLSSWLIDGTKTQTISAPSPIANELTWEKSTTTNIGIDAAFLHNRLTLTADAYIRDTEDMLVAGKVLPAVFGASSPKQNAGNLRTKGYELVVAWRDNFSLAEKTFNYNAQFLFGDAVSHITKFDNPNNLLSNYYVGQQIGEIWGYHIDGMFQSQEEADAWAVDQSQVNAKLETSAGQWAGLKAGDLRFVDLNGDGKITSGKNTADDPGDRTIIGNSQPRFNYGFSVGGDWNGFDISAIFQGVGRRFWYPDGDTNVFWGPMSRPYVTFIPEDFGSLLWSEENPDAYFPVLRGYTALTSTGCLGVNNDRYLQNIGYLRLKNLVIGYTLPEKVLNKLNMQQLRIYVSGENLATWSPIKTDYIDPEQPIGDYSNARTYPMAKTFSVGLNVTF